MASPTNNEAVREVIAELQDLKRGGHPTTGIIVKLNESQQGRDLLGRIDEYRRYSGRTWKTFVLLGIAEYVARDNLALAQEIIDYVARVKPQGRPKEANRE